MKCERPCLSNERQGRFWCSIQDGHTLYPVEIKVGMTVRRDAIKNFTELESMQDFEVGYGHVICQAPGLYPLSCLEFTQFPFGCYSQTASEPENRHVQHRSS